MKTIYKYALRPGDQAIEMPVGAKILDIQNQTGILTLWALVDDGDSVEHEFRAFSVYGTGHSIPDNPGEYISTAQHGTFVWHIFAAYPTEAEGES